MRVLALLQVPADARQPTSLQKQEQLALLRRALAASRRDVHLHEAYQDLRLQGPDADRAGLVSEYDGIRARGPAGSPNRPLTPDAGIGHMVPGGVQ